MDVVTLWGLVHTREMATSLQRAHHILLKDNRELKPLFDWLAVLQVESVKDVKARSERLVELLEQVRLEREVKWYVNFEDRMIVFHNMAPMVGEFPRAVAEYLNLFYLALYSPRGTFY